MTQSARRILVGKRNAHIFAVTPQLFGQGSPPLFFEAYLNLGRGRKILLDCGLRPTCHDDQMINPRSEGFVNNQLQGRSLKNGKQLLRHGFRRWQHAGALASCWDNCRADAWG